MTSIEQENLDANRRSWKQPDYGRNHDQSWSALWM